MTIPKEVLDGWPNCATPDCPNKCCMWSGTDKCFVCWTGLPREMHGEERDRALAANGMLPIVRAAYAATHGGRDWQEET